MADLDTQLRALAKRGFRQHDPYKHECWGCKKMSVVRFSIARGSIGGRDIDVCLECGVAKSWTRRGTTDERDEDKTFTLDGFLKT
jgi:hypothetical protein